MPFETVLLSRILFLSIKANEIQYTLIFQGIRNQKKCKEPHIGRVNKCSFQEFQQNWLTVKRVLTR